MAFWLGELFSLASLVASIRGSRCNYGGCCGDRGFGGSSDITGAWLTRFRMTLLWPRPSCCCRCVAHFCSSGCVVDSRSCASDARKSIVLMCMCVCERVCARTSLRMVRSCQRTAVSDVQSAWNLRRGEGRNTAKHALMFAPPSQLGTDELLLTDESSSVEASQGKRLSSVVLPSCRGLFGAVLCSAAFVVQRSSAGCTVVRAFRLLRVGDTRGGECRA